MKNSSVVLIELEKFLFNTEKEFTTPTLKIFQEMNNENLELLRELQEYHPLIAFCSGESSSKKLLQRRFKSEDIDFQEIFILPEAQYWEIKKNMVYALGQRYNLSLYIDETENSPWKRSLKLHRLKL